MATTRAGAPSPASTARRLCLMLGGGLAAVFAVYAWGVDYVVAREIWLQQATGYSALAALLLSLSMTPIRHLAVRLGRSSAAAYLPALRRSLGITAATFALAHAALALSTYLWNSWPTVINEPFLRAGLVTLAILTALLATSFPRIVRLLRIRLWKPLHRLAYIAGIFAFQHLLLAPFADRRLVVVIFAAALALQSLRLLALAGKPGRRGESNRISDEGHRVPRTKPNHGKG